MQRLDSSQDKCSWDNMRAVNPNRVIAKQNGDPRFVGNVCKQHPEVNGLRYTVNYRCVVCALNAVKNYQSKNPEAIQQRTKDYYNSNKDVCLQRNKDWVEKNKEYHSKQKREYAQRTAEYIKERYKQYYEANYPRMLAKRNKQHADKIKRTPAWLTKDDYWMIEQAYELAALRSQMFGFPWHVDHIFPLRGKTVSGLHVPTNLQVIPAVENLRKGNRLSHE